MRDSFPILAQYRKGSLPRSPEIISLVHRLAGSAGMVGYGEISAVAGRLDDELAEPDTDTSAALNDLLDSLQRTISGKAD